MKYEVSKNERTLVINSDKLIRVLDEGIYRLPRKATVKNLKFDDELRTTFPLIDKYINDDLLKDSIEIVTVADSEIGLHFYKGAFRELLAAGTYYFWKIGDMHTFRVVDITDPLVTDVPTHIIRSLSSKYVTKFQVENYEYAKLYYDCKFVRTLDAGSYWFWTVNTDVRVDKLDTRSRTHSITGQEVLTKDKVTIRVNCFCSYSITDFDAVLGSMTIDDHTENIHLAGQMALRDFAGLYTLDEILEKKDEMSRFLLERLNAKAASLYVKFSDAGIRDIILPGEIRDIMNTVLVASKKAQANVITRREEVASTRSLLNTAKLMEENATLARLKELEFLEKISSNIGTLSVNGGSDIVAQLLGLIHKD